MFAKLSQAGLAPAFLSAACAAFLVTSASAEPLVTDKAPEAAAVAKKCAKGCVILDAEDQAVLVENVNGFGQQAYMAGAQTGYEKGAQDALEALKSSPKLCPKNI